MSLRLTNAVLLTPRERIEPGAVVVSDDGRIEYAGSLDAAPSGPGPTVDLKGLTVVPGFIDVHVHGGSGVSFGEQDPRQELSAYSAWVARTGVTGYLVSVTAPDPDSLQTIVRGLAAVMAEGVPGAEPLGLHLEGPFLSREKKGAFNPAWLRLPDLDEVDAVLEAGQGWIRQVSLAPELPGADEVADRFRRAGVVVALAHTNTDYETASAALRGDFTHVTHAFNAQSGFNHRAPGVFGAVLASDRVSAELIADGIHVHPAAMKVLLRCLGSERVVLITDAMSGAGLPDGEYELVGHHVTVRDGAATLNNGTLAGSTAALNHCVRNAHRLAGATLAEAVQMASLNPARVMGFDSRLGSLEAGKDASLAVIDEEVNVCMTLVRGQVVHRDL